MSLREQDLCTRINDELRDVGKISFHWEEHDDSAALLIITGETRTAVGVELWRMADRSRRAILAWLERHLDAWIHDMRDRLAEYQR